MISVCGLHHSTWLCFIPTEIKRVVRDCSIPPKAAGKCRCPVKVLEVDAVIYVWWLHNRNYMKGKKKSILSLDMEKMVDCRVAVGILEMVNLKELKSDLKLCMNVLAWFLAALEPAWVGYMKLKWKQRGWINAPQWVMLAFEPLCGWALFSAVQHQSCISLQNKCASRVRGKLSIEYCYLSINYCKLEHAAITFLTGFI